MDAAADRLGLYLAARAGYDVDDADNFWKRLNETHPAHGAERLQRQPPGAGGTAGGDREGAGGDQGGQEAAKKALVP